MAGSVSPATGRRYGVARVCAVWDVPRSSFYLARRAAQNPAPACPEGRRGPKPAVSDADLLGAIRADLARSPWSGEGHRKVWARLRVHDGLRVARKRVLRLMRENALLSPHRARPRPVETHDRRIVTDAPNLMWAIDGTQIATVQDGKVWLFAVAEHWNAEALGWHVSKRGTRREALQAMGMAVRQQHGHLGRDAARGVQLRHDHGSCFMAEDFQTQIRAWGMTPSYAFVGQPQTNGVIERFFRTLKEQVVHGRVFQTLEGVRDAVRIFVARYNAETLRMTIWPEASSAQNSMGAVSASGRTVWVLIRRLNSSCSRSMALVVRADFHWPGGRRVKVKRRSPASSRLSATAWHLSRHLRRVTQPSVQGTGTGSSCRHRLTRL